MPKETTPFRIDFVPIPGDSLPQAVESFEVQVKANVATTDLYQAISPAKLQQEGTQLTGFLFNPTTEAATIPQLLTSYYNREQQLVWVDATYVDESVRQQRKQPFEITLYTGVWPQICASGLSTVSVNGLPNQSISDKIVPYRNDFGKAEELIEINGMPYQYLSITPNAYIGNPR